MSGEMELHARTADPASTWPHPPAVVDEIVTALVEDLSPEMIILFGSVARGRAGADSDVDLLVVMPQPGNLHEHMRRAYRALRRVRERPPVDVLVFSSADLEHWGGVVGHVINQALADGRVVYDAA